MSNWIETDPESPVRNSQPPGIGRIEVFGKTVLINNLGRNIELSHFENGHLQRQAVHHETLYPDQDESSQFDLDIHAFLKSHDGKHLLASNHHGLVRVFTLPELCLAGSLQWYGDIERTILIDDCLVGSSPGGYATDDRATDGVIISEPWGTAPMKYSFALADWGKVSVIEAAGHGNRLAVAAGRRLGLFSLNRAVGKVGIDKLLWEVDLPLSVCWIKYVPERKAFFIAGSDTFALLDEGSGGLVKQFLFDKDLAFGNGAVPLALAGDLLIGADRLGGIYSWGLTTDAAKILRNPDESQSLGFAHMAICGDHVLCGYNRGGYKILSVESDWRKVPFRKERRNR